MKNYIVVFLLLNVVSMVKAQNVVWDEYYATTVFTEDFNGDSLNRNIWSVEKFKREIGLLIDSSATLGVNNGKLELTMISCPGCQTTSWDNITYYGDYAGAEITSKQSFQYGVFECRAKYAYLLGSWPAFWIIGSDGIDCPPGGYGNEIDIAEFKSATSDPNRGMGHVIHRYYPPIDCVTPNIHTFDADIDNDFTLNNVYYDYKCVWPPDKISYYINGDLRHEVVNTGQEWYPNLYLKVKPANNESDKRGLSI